jgi:hypothetical protein
MSRKKSAQLLFPPLRKFDFGLVKDKLDGLLINVSRSLEKRAKAAFDRHDLTTGRQCMLVMLFAHVAMNCYNAVRYLISEVEPKDPLRKPMYLLVVPPINRQLMDMLFTLVYMLDDFPNRWFQYERASFREFSESVHRFRMMYKKGPDWKQFFKVADSLQKMGISELRLTTAEQKRPTSIKYWPHPGQIAEEATTSRSFLKWLHEWIYGDTSAQAHISPFGLSAVAQFIIFTLSEPREDLTKRREYQIYKFIHVSRTILTVLAIATELNIHFKLGFDTEAAYLWTIMSEYVAEAKEMYGKRYSSKV